MKQLNINYLMMALVTVFSLVNHPQVHASQDGLYIQSEELPRRGSSEYFTTKPGAKVLMSVSIWGEVNQPGNHFIAVGSNLNDALGAAGGPTGLAAVPRVKLIREKKEQYIDFFQNGENIEIQHRDVVYVRRTIKADLPLIFGGITAGVSLLTLLLVTAQK